MKLQGLVLQELLCKLLIVKIKFILANPFRDSTNKLAQLGV